MLSPLIFQANFSNQTKIRALEINGLQRKVQLRTRVDADGSMYPRRRLKCTKTSAPAAANPDAFPEPQWPTQQSLDELIGVSFSGGDRIIVRPDHPGLLRLIGVKVT